MIALSLALAFGQLDGGSDAGSDAPLAPIVVLDVVEGSLRVRPEDGGVPSTVQVVEGCYLPTESCVRAGQQKARTEGKLEEANAQGAKWVAVAFGSGAAVGVALGLVLGFTFKR